MKLQISIEARDRKFSKSMRAIRPQIEQLAQSFESVDMLDPLQTATQVLVTDEKAPGEVKEVKNSDGIFQVMAGCDPSLMGEDLRNSLKEMLLKTIELSSFSKPDEESFITLVKNW